MELFKKFIPILFFSTILGYIIYFTVPPTDWAQASTFQILSFFLPLLFLLTFLVNLFLNFLPKSFSYALGLMMIVALKATDQLNLVTTFVTLIGSALLATSFKKRLIRKPKLKNLLKKRLK